MWSDYSERLIKLVLFPSFELIGFIVQKKEFVNSPTFNATLQFSALFWIIKNLNTIWEVWFSEMTPRCNCTEEPKEETVSCWPISTLTWLSPSSQTSSTSSKLTRISHFIFRIFLPLLKRRKFIRMFKRSSGALAGIVRSSRALYLSISLFHHFFHSFSQSLFLFIMFSFSLSLFCIF